MQTTALAYKNMSSLQHSIDGFVLYLCIYVLMNTMSEAMAKGINNKSHTIIKKLCKPFKNITRQKKKS